MGPNATAIYLTGTFNQWQELPNYALKRIDENGTWELKLPAKALHHLDLYKLSIHWDGGQGERVPAWATRVVQDEKQKYLVRRCGTLSMLMSGKSKRSAPSVVLCLYTSVI